MKLARMLFKPKWQDRDAAVRLGAIAGGESDAELDAALPELTRTDPDARVRLAALKRLGDYERWRERSTADADPGVRRIARETYLSLLCGSGPRRPQLPRLIAELETLSPAELETVASQADDRELRRAALGYVTRPALLAERAIVDRDPELRQLALARIADPGILERIAERARKTDKAISRTARERLMALRLDAHDAGAIATRAIELCAQLDALLRMPGDRAAERDAIEREWRKLGDAVPAHLLARFRGAAALLERQSAPPVLPPADAIEAAAPPADAIAAAPLADPPAVAPVPEQVVATLVSQVRFDAALAAAREQAQRERERRALQLAEFERLTGEFAACIDRGDTVAAHALQARLATSEDELGSVSDALAARIEPLRARYAELRRWQHWSNQRRRRALCDEIEQLASTRAHPDAVAARVREARAEWQQLDAHENDTDGSSPLARRFHGVCQRALRPAAGYFEKRAEVRAARTREFETLLERAAAIPADSVDLKSIAAARQELSGALRSLDDVDPRERSALARRIKDAIAALSARLQARASEVETAKARLIARATELPPGDRGGPKLVRELQQQWTALGEGDRRIDQRQWREFRAACDRVFAGLDAERKRRDAEVSEQLERARKLVSEAEALLGDDNATPAVLTAQRQDLDKRWRALADVDRGEEKRFRKLLDDVQARVAGAARRLHSARYSDALARHALLRRAEADPIAAAALADEWRGAPALIDAFSRPLNARFERALAGSVSVVSDAAEEARDILVALEFAGGIASPDGDRERRMNHQVRRLSQRMRGTQLARGDDELVDLLARWFALPGPCAAELEQRFATAAEAAIAALP